MVAAEILRTIFQGVALFLTFAVGSGILAALLYLKFGSRLPAEQDRRMRMMVEKPGVDPISGDVAGAPPRPRRTAVSVPVRLR